MDITEAMFIEVQSLSAKRWLINIRDIVMIEERSNFSIEERDSIPLLRRTKTCCTIIIRGRSETFWVRYSYKKMKELLTQYGSRIKNSMD